MPNAFLDLRPEIKGETQAEDCEEQIEVTGWNWEMRNGASTEVDDDDEGSSAPHVKKLTITKIIDRATPGLVEYCLKGTAIEDATLTLRKINGGVQLNYFVILLENVMIKKVSWADSGGEEGGPVAETVVLKFEKFHMTYTVQENSGGIGMDNPNPFGWDLPKHDEHHCHERKKKKHHR